MRQGKSNWLGRISKRPLHVIFPPIPSYADQRSLRLSLPNCGDQLRNILYPTPNIRPSPMNFGLPSIGDSTIKQVRILADRCFQVAEFDLGTEQVAVPETDANALCETRCIELAESICNIFMIAHNIRASKPDQICLFILKVFELWVDMDKCANLLNGCHCSLHSLSTESGRGAFLLAHRAF